VELKSALFIGGGGGGFLFLDGGGGGGPFRPFVAPAFGAVVTLADREATLPCDVAGETERARCE
jgi:hypothetical protein